MAPFAGGPLIVVIAAAVTLLTVGIPLLRVLLIYSFPLRSSP